MSLLLIILPIIVVATILLLLLLRKTIGIRLYAVICQEHAVTHVLNQMKFKIKHASMSFY